MEFRETPTSSFRSGIPQGTFGVRNAHSTSTSSIPTAQRSIARGKPSARATSASRSEQEDSAAKEFQEFIHFQNRLGQRVAIKNAKEGTLRYVGRVHLKEGLYCGIELDEPQGLHDGQLEGRRYFQCPPQCGVFAPTDSVTFVQRTEFPTESGSAKMGRKQSSRQMNRSNSTRGPKSVSRPVAMPRAQTDDRLNLNATYNRPSNQGFDELYEMSQSYAGNESIMTRSDIVPAVLPGGNLRCNSADFFHGGGDSNFSGTASGNAGFRESVSSDNDDDMLLISSIDLDGITPPENFLQSSLTAESFAAATDPLAMSVCSNLSDSLMFLKGSHLVDSQQAKRQSNDVTTPDEVVTPVAERGLFGQQRSRADSFDDLKAAEKELGLSAEFDALEAEFLKSEPNLPLSPTVGSSEAGSEYEQTLKAEESQGVAELSDVKVNLRKSVKVADGRPVSLISTDTGYGADTDPETQSGGARSNNISPSDDMLDAYETCSSQSQISTPKAVGPRHSPRLSANSDALGDQSQPEGEFDTVVCEIVMRDGSGNIIRIMKEERKIPKQFLADPRILLDPSSLSTTSTSTPCSEVTTDSTASTPATVVVEPTEPIKPTSSRPRERHNTITLSDEPQPTVVQPSQQSDVAPVAETSHIVEETPKKMTTPSKSAAKPPKSSKIISKTATRSNSVVATTKTPAPSVPHVAKASSVEPETRKQPRLPKKSRFDEVMSKINASIAQEKTKPKKAEVKSKVFTEAKVSKGPSQPATPSSECDMSLDAEKTPASVSESHSVSSSPAPTVVTPLKTTKLAETMPTTSTVRAPPKTGIAVKHHSKPIGAKENKIPSEHPPVVHNEPKKLTSSQNHTSAIRSVTTRQPLHKEAKDSLPSLSSRTPTSSVSKPSSSSHYSSVSTRSAAVTKAPEPPVEVAPVGPSLKETITKLEAELVERNKEVGHGKISLKHATTGFQAMVVLVQYLTEELDAFSMPMMLETAKRVEKEMNEIKTQYDGALQECSALKAQISQLVEAHRVEIEQLAQNNKAKLEGLTKSLSDGFEESKQWLAQEHQKEIEQIKQEEVQQHKRLQLEFNAKLAQTVEDHVKLVESLKKKGRKQSEELVKVYEKKASDVDTNHKTLVANLNMRIGELEKQRDHYKEEVGSLQATLMKDSDTRVQMAVAKFKNLPQEIDSLKVVVEMRSQEIHHLRSQNLEYQRQLEEVPALKERMRTLEAKHENLKEVLSIKIQAEKNLSHEYRQLLENYEREARQNKRLSMQKEELQWKLQESLMSQSFPGEQALPHTFPRINTDTESDSDMSGSHNPQTQSCFASLPSPSPLKAYSSLGTPSPRRGDVPVQIFTSTGGPFDAETITSAAKSGVVLRAKSADTNLRRKLVESTPGDFVGSSHTGATMLPSAVGSSSGALKNPRAKSVDKSVSPNKRRPPPLRGFGLTPASNKSSTTAMSSSFTGEMLPDVPENQSDSPMMAEEGIQTVKRSAVPQHHNVSPRSKHGGPGGNIHRQSYSTGTQSTSGGIGNITDSGIFTSYVSETDSDNLMMASVTSVGGESVEAEGHDGDTELSDSDAMALQSATEEPIGRNVVPLAVVNGKARFIPPPSKRDSPSSCSSSDKEMTPPCKPTAER